MPNLIIASLIAISTLIFFILMSDAPWLEQVRPGGMRLGYVLAAVCMCTTAGASFRISAPDTALRIFSVGSLIAAATWLPISMLLAGNMAASYDADGGLEWFLFSICVVMFLFCVLIWAVAVWIFNLLTRKGAA